MIDDVLLRRIARETSVPLGTIEKDFAIVCALSTLTEDQIKDQLVFKGGTAIKKVYDPDARFSEDLDFCAPSLSNLNLIDVLERLYNSREVETITFLGVVKEFSSPVGKRFRIRFEGPLHFKNSIRIDFSWRNDVILDVKERPIFSSYRDLKPDKIRTLEFTEIIAEKLRVLMTRGYPRDYFDIWCHIDKIQKKDFLRNLTKKKCDLVGYEYAPSKIFEKNSLDLAKSDWEVSLRHLVTLQNSFEEIISELKQKLGFL